MADERDFDGKSELCDVIAALLALAPAMDQRKLIPRLTDAVSDKNRRRIGASVPSNSRSIFSIEGIPSAEVPLGP